MTEPAIDRPPAPVEEENDNAWKRSAWKKPSNAGQEVPVMGAHSWPALSEAASATAKGSSSKSSASKANLPLDNSQPTATIPLSPPTQVVSTTQDHTNNTIPSHQRSTRRNANSSSYGGVTHPPAQQPSERLPQRLPRHPHPSPMSPPFIIPPRVPPFAGPTSFHDFQPPMYYPPPRGVPTFPPMSPPLPMFIPFADSQLPSRIVNQIDYYFSNENLVKDVYLRQNMDEQGWVSINLIAGFKKVSCLTKDIQLILDALRNSMVVEVQGDKVRSRYNWMTWAPRDSIQLAQPQGNFVAGVQNLSLDPNTSGWGQAGVGSVEASLS